MAAKTRTVEDAAKQLHYLIPNRCAIRAFGTPSAASLRISAQSSKVITPPSLSAHFSPPKVFSFRAPPTLGTMGREDLATLTLAVIRGLVMDLEATRERGRVNDAFDLFLTTLCGTATGGRSDRQR